MLRAARSILTALLFVAACLSLMVVPVSALAGEVLYNGIVLPDEWPPRIERFTREVMPVPYLENEGRGVRGEGREVRGGERGGEGAKGRGGEEREAVGGRRLAGSGRREGEEGEVRPSVVPIDVGRQLFVDDFLVESTTLYRSYHTARYHPASPVLKPDKPWESVSKSSSPARPIAMVFSDGVWYDPADKLFKMWYMAGACSSTCYAVSTDGIYWDKPALDVVPGTNIVMDRERDSTTVWIDQNERNPAKRYKMLAFQPPKGRPDAKTNPWHSALYYSADGIHWSEPVGLHISDCDRTTFFHNPFRDLWVFSIRGYISWPIYRCRYYAESKELDESYPQVMAGGVRWACSDHLDPRHSDPELKETFPQLYNLDAAAYESITLGLFSIWQGMYDKSKGQNTGRQVLVGYSRDGFHWSRPDRRVFVGNDETDGAWNWGNVQSAGGTCLVVGDQLYFYVSGRGKKAATDPCSTGLAVLRRDGFASMDAMAETGTLTTRPVTFKGKHFFVNAEIFREGELRVEVLDRDGKAVAGLGMDDCLPIVTDSTLTAVRWKGGGDLGALAGQPVRFRFQLNRGKLYAFWVSPEESGASHGYVAAGGPGYTGPSDTVGSAARPAAAALTMLNPCKSAPVIECPAWAKESVPVWVQPYRGKYGLPAPYKHQKKGLGGCTAGIDMWQANHFVGYCPQTAKYLYEDYTPLKVDYVKGALPYCEQIVAKYTAGLKTDREKALALLKRAIPENMGHPCILPYSTDVRPDRAMTEDELLKSGLGWCNEQARVFTRLCQIAGIPSRVIFLFYSDMDGHVISEFHADGRWCMADSSWGAVFPGADGKLMSAAQCHADAASKHLVQEAYVARARELVPASDEFLVGMRYKDVADPVERAKKIADNMRGLRENLQSGKQAGKLGDNLWAFGVINLPSPK